MDTKLFLGNSTMFLGDSTSSCALNLVQTQKKLWLRICITSKAVHVSDVMQKLMGVVNNPVQGCTHVSCIKLGLMSQVKALNGLIREVTGIKPHAFWKPMEANGESGKGKRAGVALNRPNKKKYRKGLPWQRHNGFGHRIRKFCVKYAPSPSPASYVALSDDTVL